MYFIIPKKLFILTKSTCLLHGIVVVQKTNSIYTFLSRMNNLVIDLFVGFIFPHTFLSYLEQSPIEAELALPSLCKAMLLTPGVIVYPVALSLWLAKQSWDYPYISLSIREIYYYHFKELVCCGNSLNFMVILTWAYPVNVYMCVLMTENMCYFRF